MKKIKSLIFLLFAAVLGFGSVATFASQSLNKEAIPVNAEKTETFPRSGTSGTIMYVSGQSTYFNNGEADLAIYCFNSASESAWSDRVSYRVFGDILRVMLPYKDGQSKTWAKFIICRYNPNLDPSTSGFDGVYNQTDDLYFSSFIQRQNTITVIGYGENGKLLVSEMKYFYEYFGTQGENHMYLDLSGFTDWDKDGAKFAIYFAYPDTTNETRWSQQYSKDGYYSSFCWKVNGQDNDHLYECIVPNLYGGNNYSIWNMVIAVRFSPDAQTPSWNDMSLVWNQTQNLSFNTYNHTNNIIRVDNWSHAELDNVNIISRETRLEFYGRYFLNTVVCSGNGNSDATTNDMWNAVKFEYEHHLSRVFQGDIWKLDTEGKETLIAEAMRRYDYITDYKKYNHEDFINRHPINQNDSNSNIMNDKKNSYVSIIVLGSISLLALLGLITIIVVKKIRNRTFF